MENLDLGYGLMKLAQKQSADGVGALLLTSNTLNQETQVVQALCKKWGPANVLSHLYLLAEYGLIYRPDDLPRYWLSPMGKAFLSSVDNGPGWAWVKQGVADTPVRPTMNEVCRWVSDGCPTC